VDPEQKVTLTPRQIFEAVLVPCFFQTVACETNRYAAQRQKLQRKRDVVWEDTNKEEVTAFVGVLIQMYWKESFFTSVIPGVFPKNRFEKLLQYLHVNNNEDKDEKDPFFQVRPLIRLLEASFANNEAEDRVAIDEAMAPYSGRSSFITYMPKKPHPWGTKFWLLVNCTNKMVLRFQPYCGKVDGKREVGLGERVVMDLLTSRQLGVQYTLLTAGRTVYVDNFFNSPSLCNKLTPASVTVVGTCRTNRIGYPTVQAIDKEQGAWAHEQEESLIGIAWYDKKTVNFLTNGTDNVCTTTAGNRES
jgi:hypothetical protein